MVGIEIRDRDRVKGPPPPSPYTHTPSFAWCPLINLQHFCYSGIVQNKLTNAGDIRNTRFVEARWWWVQFITGGRGEEKKKSEMRLNKTPNWQKKSPSTSAVRHCSREAYVCVWRRRGVRRTGVGGWRGIRGRNKERAIERKSWPLDFLWKLIGYQTILVCWGWLYSRGSDRAGRRWGRKWEEEEEEKERENALCVGEMCRGLSS